jgi:transposase-like protein
MRKQTPKNTQSRSSYTPEFKRQAIDLAHELGSVPEAAEKLGIKNFQTLAAWVRQDKKKSTDTAHKELLEMKEENKRLKKELEKEKKVTAILRDAAAFFCQENQK